MQPIIEPLVPFGKTAIEPKVQNDPETILRMRETQAARQRFAALLNTALDAIPRCPTGRGRQSWLAEAIDVSQKAARKWLVGDAFPVGTKGKEFAAIGIALEDLRAAAWQGGVPKVTPNPAINNPARGLDPARQERSATALESLAQGNDNYANVAAANAKAISGNGLPHPPVSEPSSSVVRIGLIAQPSATPLVELRSLSREEAMGVDLPPAAVSLIFEREWVSSHLGAIPAAHIRILCAPSDRMRNEFDKGDLLIIDTRTTTFDRDGVFAFTLHGSIWVQGIQRMIDGGVKVLSANPAYEPETLNPQAVSRIQIIGAVVKVLSVKTL